MNRGFALVWPAMLVAGSAALTMVYTCITPFAAFAVIGALTLSRGHALALTVAVWLANQVVGFGVLSYPWTARTFAWGLAIGVSAVIATFAAGSAVRRLDGFRMPAQIVVAFVAAFGLYQLALYTAATAVLGGTAAFATSIVVRVLTVNALALVGLLGLHQLVVAAAALIHRRRAHGSAARVA
jgi:hypothetical protein